MAAASSDSTARFNALCRIAVKATGNQSLHSLCSSPSSERWIDLIKLVDNWSAGRSVFYYALHGLKWGVLPQSCPNALANLSIAIANEIAERG